MHTRGNTGTSLLYALLLVRLGTRDNVIPVRLEALDGFACLIAVFFCPVDCNVSRTAASMRKAGVGRAAQISTLLASATLGGAFGYSGAFLGFFN
jgi:hypothetical protein